MYVSDYNKQKGKEKVKNKVFWLLTVFFFVLVALSGAIKNDVNPVGAFLVCMLFAWIFSFILTPFFAFFVARSLQKREEALEERDFQKQIRRSAEEKRAMLMVDFEFLRNVEMMKAHQDMAKMQALARLQQQIEHAKERDLARLQQQIERMKREL